MLPKIERPEGAEAGYRHACLCSSIQNQYLADWLNFEVGHSQKIASPHTPQVSRGPSAAPGRPVSRCPSSNIIEAQKQRQNAEVRGLLCAGAEVWKDGSGLSVADVYSADKASTPKKEQDDGSGVQEGAAMVLSDAGVPALSAPVAVVGSAASMPGTNELVTPSPRIARIASSPAVRTSGRKRVMPARFGTKRWEFGVACGACEWNAGTMWMRRNWSRQREI